MVFELINKALIFKYVLCIFCRDVGEISMICSRIDTKVCERSRQRLNT